MGKFKVHYFLNIYGYFRHICNCLRIWISLVQHELLAHPVHVSPSPMVLSGVSVSQSLVFYVVFCTLSFFFKIIVISVVHFTISDYFFDIITCLSFINSGILIGFKFLTQILKLSLISPPTVFCLIFTRKQWSNWLS